MQEISDFWKGFMMYSYLLVKQLRVSPCSAFGITQVHMSVTQPRMPKSVIIQNTSKHHMLHSFTHYTLPHYTLCDAVPICYDLNNDLLCAAILFKAWISNLMLRSMWKAGEKAGS